jgi:hypothetical protein
VENSLEPMISEADARSLVRLVAEVASLNGSIQTKKRHLMTNLAGIIDADAWAWILSRAGNSNDNHSVVEHLHAGMDER